MQIDLEKLEQLINEGDSILFSPEAEEVLVQFYQLKKQVEEAEQKIKQKIEETALKLSPTFTGIKGEKVSIRYQAYGAKYKIDESRLESIPKNLYTTKYSPNAKEIDLYQTQAKELPTGIFENERKKVVSITVKKKNVAVSNQETVSF